MHPARTGQHDIQGGMSSAVLSVACDTCSAGARLRCSRRCCFTIIRRVPTVQDVYIIAGARTPVGVLQGALSDVTATDLGVIAAKGAIERSGVDPQLIDQVVLGNVIQSSKDAIYFARHVALKAGLPIDTPALTVNRLCGSGLQAIVSATQLLQLGEGRIALAGGAENMTQAPHVLRRARPCYKPDFLS